MSSSYLVFCSYLDLYISQNAVLLISNLSSIYLYFPKIKAIINTKSLCKLQKNFRKSICQLNLIFDKSTNRDTMNSTFLHAYQTHYFLSYGKSILTRQSQCHFESFPPTLNLNQVTFEAEWNGCLSFLQFSIFKVFILDEIVQNRNLRWFKIFKSKGNRIENRRKDNSVDLASGLTPQTQCTAVVLSRSRAEPKSGEADNDVS